MSWQTSMIKRTGLGMITMNSFDESELATLIEYWYQDWKYNIVGSPVPHKFGYAKEDLKSLLSKCPEDRKYYVDRVKRLMAERIRDGQ